MCVDRWFRQHEHIEKLNMQAILSATAMHDEFVKEVLVSYGKVTSLHVMRDTLLNYPVVSIYILVFFFSPSLDTRSGP